MEGMSNWLIVSTIATVFCLFIFVGYVLRLSIAIRTATLYRYFLHIKLKAAVKWYMSTSVLAVVAGFSAYHSGLLNSQNDALGSTLMVIESPYDLVKTVENIQQAIYNSNNRFIRKQYVDNGFVSKRHESKKEVAVYFCNFRLLNKTLKEDKRIGVFLPFQVTAIERQGKVRIVALNPKQLGNRLLGSSKIKSSLNEVHDAYMEIMNEATI